MPGNKFNILCTSEMNISSKEFLYENISIDVIPFIEKKIIKTSEIKNKVHHYSNKIITAVFTSKTAVSSVASMFKNLPSWKIYCIENTTKNAVELYFPGCAIAGTAGNAGDLAKIIIANNETGIVFFCGNKRLGDLPVLLKDAGIHVEECIIYETNILGKEILKKYDAILFLSPSAVQGFFENNTPGSDTVFFSMGEKTTESIHHFSENQIHIASYPDKEKLLSEAISFLRQQTISQ